MRCNCRTLHTQRFLLTMQVRFTFESPGSRALEIFRHALECRDQLAPLHGSMEEHFDVARVLFSDLLSVDPKGSRLRRHLKSDISLCAVAIVAIAPRRGRSETLAFKGLRATFDFLD